MGEVHKTSAINVWCNSVPGAHTEVPQRACVSGEKHVESNWWFCRRPGHHMCELDSPAYLLHPDLHSFHVGTMGWPDEVVPTCSLSATWPRVDEEKPTLLVASTSIFSRGIDWNETA
jgi:hypothetical protein